MGIWNFEICERQLNCKFGMNFHLFPNSSWYVQNILSHLYAHNFDFKRNIQRDISNAKYYKLSIPPLKQFKIFLLLPLFLLRFADFDSMVFNLDLFFARCTLSLCLAQMLHRPTAISTNDNDDSERFACYSDAYIISICEQINLPMNTRNVK